MNMDGRTHTGFRKTQTENHGNTVFGSLQFRLPKHNNNQCQHKRPRSNTLARTTRWKIKTDRFCQSISLGYREEIYN